MGVFYIGAEGRGVVVVCHFQPSSLLIQVLWVWKAQFSYRLDGSVP